jgi:alkanesulfonate monooxygenase SsuD/methylene tetrahydromethanopterin reductase-like flavin-dependent oxidoreductase (luciferase family)
MVTLGVIFPPDLPPERLRSVAVAADDAGLQQLWLWEDCFKESAIATAASALAWTERLTLGIGLLPVPLRNVALTAMELATLERLFPGRVVTGIGHGVLPWMEQVGARAESPMTLLREYTGALYDLLNGSTVTTSGRYVQLDKVALDWPPATAPPLLVGAVKPRTAALAGELSDGVIFSGETSLADLREVLPHVHSARAESGRDGSPDVVVFVPIEGDHSAADVAAQLAEFAAAGATHLVLLEVGAGPSLEEWVAFVARDVRPLVG